MSEEEKKAIEIIKGLYIEEYDWYEDSKYCTGHSGKAVAIVEDSLEKILNLIDNQQKEIEELKKDNDTLSELVIVNEDKVIKELDLISKDKIREKIEHYNNELEHIKNGEEFENEKPMYYWGKVALEDLLEEN